MNTKDLNQISENIWLLKEAKAVVSFSTTPSVTSKPGNSGKKMKIATAGDQEAEIWSWGKNNLLPQERESLIFDNNIVAELLATKRDITIGQGLYCYREHFEPQSNGKMKRIIEEVDRPAGAKEFWKRNNERKYLMRSASNLMFHANTFSEMVRDLGGRIHTVEAFECRHVRPETMNNMGVIKRYFLSGNWKERNKPEYLPKPVAAYMGEDAKQPKFMYHAMDDLLSDDYLGIPTWWGSRAWIEAANAIPMFHISNLRHGYTIRYHIEIPKDYFWDNTALQVTAEQKDAALRKESEARQQFLERLNDFLAGYEQAGRAIITEYTINRQLAKEFPGIKITPISVDLKDEALLKLFERSNDAVISAQGVHPTLAAIQTQGKLSSGSEIRNAFNMYVAIKTPVKRAVLLEPIQMIHDINGWGEGIKWGFRDIEMTTVDEKPSGIQQADPTAQTPAA